MKFAASGPDSLRGWLHKILHLPSGTWWKENSCRILLLLEVLELIRAKKSQRQKELKHHTAILPLEVRGKVLWFQNTIRCVTLVLLEDKGPREGARAEPAEEGVP